MNLSIRLENERDYAEVEFLTREAFWDKYRPGCCEHLILNKLRKTPSFVGELSFVACDGDRIIGNIVYSRAQVVDDEDHGFEVRRLACFSRERRRFLVDEAFH
jgi:predicted N-acetyltransferase YhbS